MSGGAALVVDGERDRAGDPAERPVVDVAVGILIDAQGAFVDSSAQLSQ